MAKRKTAARAKGKRRGSACSPRPRRRRKWIQKCSRTLTIKEILAWADEHHARTGKWPIASSGPVRDVPGETWSTVNGALIQGLRGLYGGSSLAKLLAKRRGVRNIQDLPRLTIKQILAWVDAYHRRTGRWPNQHSGRVAEVSEESWSAINGSLRQGLRGLSRGSSLAKLIAKRRGVRNRAGLPELTIKKVLAWIDDYRRRTGKWPTTKSGHVPLAPQETWVAINRALDRGNRGLPGGSSLAQLMDQHRRPKKEANLASASHSSG